VIGAIEFDSNGKHYIVDLLGETDYDFEKDHIGGRCKCDVEVLSPEEEISDEELAKVIFEMDKSTFRFNIFDDGVEPEYRQFEGNITFNGKCVEIDKIGKQPMTVRQFFDLLRRYPDWDKDIVIENKKTKKLDDIVNIVCDERNGNLIIVKKEN
jgi:hypothetical protein